MRHLILALSYNALAAEVRLVTLDYPPYTSAELPNGGSMIEQITQAFAATGHRVSITVLPWARALLEVNHGKYDGILPLWPEEVSTANLIGSRPLQYSDLGLYMRCEQPVVFEQLNQLRGRRVGIARGYGYPQSILNSGITTEEGADDLINLRKLAAKRFDLVLLERTVGEYLLQSNPDLQKTLCWQGQTLVRLPMNIGFAQPKAGQQENWPELFEQGMQQLSGEGK